MNNKKEYAKIRKQIMEQLISGYKCKINFNDPSFLIEIEDNLIIAAIPYKKNNQIVYEFVFDIRFIGSDYVISYEEVKMINGIIEILYNYKEIIVSKFRQYTVEEYDYEEEKANYILDSFARALENTLKKAYEERIDKENKVG